MPSGAIPDMQQFFLNDCCKSAFEKSFPLSARPTLWELCDIYLTESIFQTRSGASIILTKYNMEPVRTPSQLFPGPIFICLFSVFQTLSLLLQNPVFSVYPCSNLSRSLLRAFFSIRLTYSPVKFELKYFIYFLLKLLSPQRQSHISEFGPQGILCFLNLPGIAVSQSVSTRHPQYPPEISPRSNL